MKPFDVKGFLAAQRSPDASDRIALVEMVRQGFPVSFVERVAKQLDLSLGDLTAYGVVAARTLSHSKPRGKLSRTQSDRVARFFRILQGACETFGNLDKAKAWLTRPTRALSGRAPIGLLDTEEGARLVESLLTRIDHGLAA